MSPLRNPPSDRVECWSEPVFGSTIGDAGGAVAADLRAAAAALRAGVLRDVPDLVDPFAEVERVLAVVRDDAGLRAADVRDLAAVVFFAVPDVFDPADLRDAVEPARADVVDRERLAADVDLRVVPDLDGVVFFAVVLLAPVDLAVVVMTFAAASIALAASVIALVALVIALVIAVIALADEDALVATDFICVAAVLAWLAALVTRFAAAAGVRLDAAAGFLAVVVDDVPDLAADVRFAAGFLAVVDFVVLFVRDAVLVGTDLPPVMISYGEIYSTLCNPLHT